MLPEPPRAGITISLGTWTDPRILPAFATILDAKRGSELSDEDVAQCVTIYQERVDKVSDVRMVVMGGDVFAFEITQNGEQHFDFRVGFYQENHLKYEAIPVPPSLKKKMLGLMDSLQINLASADFALKADGDWIFLDLNPNGQWLFVEESFPESRIGPKFCSFFVNGTVDPKAETLFPSFSEYKESDAAQSLEEAASPALCRSNSTHELVEEEPCGGITPTSAILAANDTVR
jgi:hypothetical protein